MTEDNLQQMLRLMEIKNNLMNYIGIDNFIEEFKSVIDNSKSFEFLDSNSKKFIDKRRPEFKVRLKDTNHPDVYTVKSKQHSEYDKFVDSVTLVIAREITGETSNLLEKYITNNEELKKEIDSFNNSLTTLILSNVFSIRVANPEDNMIFINMVI